MALSSEERQLRALAAGLQAVPVDTGRAWRRVRGRLPRATAPAVFGAARSAWAAASLSLVAGCLALSQTGVSRALAAPDLSAHEAPAPRILTVTPATVGAAAPATGTHWAPRLPGATPIPLPPQP